MILFLRCCNQRVWLEQGSQSNVACSVWQHEDRSLAQAAHARQWTKRLPYSQPRASSKNTLYAGRFVTMIP